MEKYKNLVWIWMCDEFGVNELISKKEIMDCPKLSHLSKKTKSDYISVFVNDWIKNSDGFFRINKGLYSFSKEQI